MRRATRDSRLVLENRQYPQGNLQDERGAGSSERSLVIVVGPRAVLRLRRQELLAEPGIALGPVLRILPLHEETRLACVEDGVAVELAALPRPLVRHELEQGVHA